jgi:amidase
MFRLSITGTQLLTIGKWRLWFQTGAKETLALVASSGEPLYPTFEWYLKTFDIKELTVPELFKVSQISGLDPTETVTVLMVLQLNTKQAEWRYQFAEAWHNTQTKTGTGRPIDCLIAPCAPSAGFPHGFPVWWGYFSLWNLLDYPSVILPLKKMRVDVEKDKKDMSYVPKDNVFDKMNWEICKLSSWPILWRLDTHH